MTLNPEVVRAEADHEAGALTTWLAMLGWQVELELDGPVYAGLARHITGDGQALAVGACAATKSETVWQLFEAVMARLGKDETLRVAAPHVAA